MHIHRPSIMFHRGLVSLAFLLTIFPASEAAAQNILVFGSPGLNAGSNTVTRRFADWGYTATIVDDAAWGALTQADFESFDAVYTDGICDSVDWAPPMAANQTNLMAAVTGRMYLSVGDPDAHTTAGGTSGPDRATHNALEWASALGSTASGGQTGLVFHSGCAEAWGIDAFGQFPSFGAITTVFSSAEASAILPAAAAHPTMTTPSLLTAADFQWGDYCHGTIAIGTSPAEYTEAIQCIDGNVGVLLRGALVPNVLVYSPAGTASSFIITETGLNVTTVDAASWCGMTTNDFGSYDAIYFGGILPAPQDQPDNCAGAIAGTPGTSTWAEIIVETQGTWGPASSGHVYTAVGDADYHTPSQVGAHRVVENAVTWAAGEGRSSSGGHTGMVIFTGGLEGGAVFLLDQLSPTFGAFASNYAESEAWNLLSLSHTVNTTPNALVLADYVWGNLCHGEITAIPGDFIPLVECDSGNLGVAIRGILTGVGLASVPNPSTFGQSVTFTATVSPSAGTGTVDFLDNGTTLLGNVSVSGGLAALDTSVLAVGTHSITAHYSGDGTYAPASSSPLFQVVDPATTTTSLGSDLNPSLVGQSVTFTATVSPSAATGTVDFLDNGTTLLGNVSVSGGVATLSTSSLSVGNHSITAEYGGDAGHLASASSTLFQVVNLVTTTTSLGSNLNPSMVGDLVTFTATVTPSSATGSVSFKDGGTPLGSGSLSVGVATFSTSALSVGNHSITAEYGGDVIHLGSTSSTLFQLVTAVPIFADGFESGNSSAWTNTVP